MKISHLERLHICPISESVVSSVDKLSAHQIRFIKKTKIPLTVCLSTTNMISDNRAVAKLGLAIPSSIPKVQSVLLLRLERLLFR